MIDNIDGFASEGCKSRPGVCLGVDPHAEPGHTVGTEDTENRRQRG